MLFSLLVIAAAVTTQQADQSIFQQYPADFMRIMWWVLGILASFAVFVSCGTTIWVIKKVMQHDVDIIVIKSRCELHREELEDEES